MRIFPAGGRKFAERHRCGKHYSIWGEEFCVGEVDPQESWNWIWLRLRLIGMDVVRWLWSSSDKRGGKSAPEIFIRAHWARKWYLTGCRRGETEVSFFPGCLDQMAVCQCWVFKGGTCLGKLMNRSSVEFFFIILSFYFEIITDSQETAYIVHKGPV